MHWTTIFRYKSVNISSDVWEYIHFAFCYAGFLWFASDEDLAWLKIYSDKTNMLKGLEDAYKRIIKNKEAAPVDYAKEEQEAFNQGYNAPLKFFPNLYQDKDNYIREYWEENRRWEHYGYTPEEMERRRRRYKAGEPKPGRRERMNEPIVYEKAINDYETLVFRDKIDGEYTVYIMRGKTVNLERVDYKTTKHIYDCPSFDKR